MNIRRFPRERLARMTIATRGEFTIVDGEPGFRILERTEISESGSNIRMLLFPGEVLMMS